MNARLPKLPCQVFIHCFPKPQKSLAKPQNQSYTFVNRKPSKNPKHVVIKSLLLLPWKMSKIFAENGENTWTLPELLMLSVNRSSVAIH